MSLLNKAGGAVLPAGLIVLVAVVLAVLTVVVVIVLAVIISGEAAEGSS